MLLKKQKPEEAKLSPERISQSWNVLLEDLRLLASVVLAHFIVWRTLRQRYKENSARRQKFKLLRAGSSMAQGKSEVLNLFDWRANVVANGNRILRQRGKQGG